MDPLVMEGRDEGHNVSATYMDLGTDVNFGSPYPQPC
jgi:malate dehydrogenase (quinone)